MNYLQSYVIDKGMFSLLQLDVLQGTGASILYLGTLNKGSACYKHAEVDIFYQADIVVLR